MFEIDRPDKSILIGLGLAVLVHVLILSVRLNTVSVSFGQELLINVNLQSPEEIAKKNLSQQKPIAAKQETKQAVVTEPLNKKVEIEKPSVLSIRPSNDRPTQRIAISPHSSQFKFFLESEIALDRENGSPQQTEFTNSFGPKFPSSKKPKDLEYSQGPLGGGNYKVVKNGHVRCQLQLVPLTVADLDYAFPPMSKDCSPPEKFNLKLNQPVDGHMDAS